MNNEFMGRNNRLKEKEKTVYSFFIATAHNSGKTSALWPWTQIFFMKVSASDGKHMLNACDLKRTSSAEQKATHKYKKILTKMRYFSSIFYKRLIVFT